MSDRPATEPRTVPSMRIDRISIMDGRVTVDMSTAPQDGPPPPCGPLEQLCDERCFRCGGTYRGRNT